jgi:hypothetical protein
MTQRARWTAVAAAAAAVAAAAIALLVANRSHATAKTGDGSASGASSATPASGDTGPAPTAPTLDPGSAGTAASGASTASDRPDVTTVDEHGAAIHDHRDVPGDFKRPPPDHVPWNKPVRVTGKFAGDVSSQVVPIAAACTSQIPAEARGEKPVIQVQLVVSVKGGVFSIDSINTELRDVTGDTSAVVDCVKSKAGAITMDASTQPDVDHYPITMPMRIASNP